MGHEQARGRGLEGQWHCKRQKHRDDLHDDRRNSPPIRAG
ncbi:hypothetical protein SCAR479_13470 [Seiridium cardinale]|uniref:Uncharacterized protein n=1 Tax=Seiridium cardinale TaxID=138064 RepID=A0ABR2X7W7_9PEZI